MDTGWAWLRAPPTVRVAGPVEGPASEKSNSFFLVGLGLLAFWGIFRH